MSYIGASAQCMGCRHYDRIGSTTDGLLTKAVGYCTAYPQEDETSPGIPMPIWSMQVDHRQPYPGDHGIQWEPKTPGAAHPLDDPRVPPVAPYNPVDKFTQPAEDIIFTHPPKLEAPDGR